MSAHHTTQEMPMRAHIHRACSPVVVLLSLLLVGLAAYGAIPRPEPTVWNMGRADLGIWV